MSGIRRSIETQHINTPNSQIDKDQWELFVKESKVGSIFQTPQMFEVFYKTKNYEPIAIFCLEEDMIVGVLVAVIIRISGGLTGFLSRRVIIYGGPIYKNNDSKVLSALLKKYNHVIKRKAIFTQIRNLFDYKSSIEVFRAHNFSFEEHLDFHIDVSQNIDDIFKNVKKGRKRNLTKAKNKGVRFKETNDDKSILKAYQLIKETYRRINLPFPDHSHFFNLIKSLSDRGHVKLFSAQINDRMIGCRFVLLFNGIAYDYYAGHSNEYKNYYPNDFLILNILEYLTESENFLFDFGGAGKPNIPYPVRDYKETFGGKVINHGRFTKIHLPLLYTISIAGFKFWKMIKKNLQ